MQNQSRILRLIVLIIINVIVLVLVVMLSNFTFAQEIPVLHQELYGISKYTPSKQNAYITVGNSPSSIGVVSPSKSSIFHVTSDTIYVANSDDNTVSVINGINNIKVTDIHVGGSPTGIGVDGNTIYIVVTGIHDNVTVINGNNNKKITDIPVEYPTGIGVDDSLHIIYVAQSYHNNVTAIYGGNNKKITDIIVRASLTGIDSVGVDKYKHIIYVANSDDNTVTAIDGYHIIYDHKLTNITDITVGHGPRAIGVDGITETIYVANSDDNTVSVINGTNYKKITDITVGHGPRAIGVDGNTVYVANSDDNTVSVINGTNYKKITDIPVGKYPTGIGVDEFTHTIYVANRDENTVSVIDPDANRVVAGIMFRTEPFNAGYIECDNATGKIKAPISQQFYAYSGFGCTAKSYPGFEFASWQENLGRNSTQLISLVPPPSIVDSILDSLHMNADKPEATLNITKFGSFTADFRALPPAIPPEYVATLIGVVATAFIGTWLTPALIGWRKTKTQLKYFKECISQIGKLDKNAIEDKIIGYYADGNLSDVQHQLLNDKISVYYGKEKGSERYGAPFT